MGIRNYFPKFAFVKLDIIYNMILYIIRLDQLLLLMGYDKSWSEIFLFLFVI